MCLRKVIKERVCLFATFAGDIIYLRRVKAFFINAAHVTYPSVRPLKNVLIRKIWPAPFRWMLPHRETSAPDRHRIYSNKQIPRYRSLKYISFHCPGTIECRSMNAVLYLLKKCRRHNPIDTTYILITDTRRRCGWRLREGAIPWGSNHVIDFHPSPYLLCLPTIKTDQNN